MLRQVRLTCGGTVVPSNSNCVALTDTAPRHERSTGTPPATPASGAPRMPSKGPPPLPTIAAPVSAPRDCTPIEEIFFQEGIDGHAESVPGERDMLEIDGGHSLPGA